MGNLMIVFVIIFFIVIVVPFVYGLIYFLRSLFSKESPGCGLSGFIVMTLIGLFVYFFFDIIDYETEKTFIHGFEKRTELSYPISGKIKERKNNSGFNALGDYAKEAIIEMNSIDYEKLLQEVQLSPFFELDSMNRKERQPTPSRILKKQIPSIDFDYVYKDTRRWSVEHYLWFHKNKQTVFYQDIKN